MLPALYLGEAIVFVALAATADNFSLALVIALAVVDGTLAIAARTFTRASAAAVLTPSGQLREGNAIINVGFTIAGAAGPAIAGVVVAVLGRADGAAARRRLLRDRGRRARRDDVAAPGAGRGRAVGQPPARGARLRARHARAVAAAGDAGAAFVFFTLVLPIEIVYAKETLDAGDSGYGALLSSWGVGMVVGSLVFVAVARRAPLRPQLV